MISVVCAYNNQPLLHDWLISSLKAQTAEHEIILIDSIRYGYQSAAEALNAGGKEAKGDYIMFVHQDVRLLSVSWLRDAEVILDGIPNLGIAGVVGSVPEGASVAERMRNVICHGDALKPIGNPIRSPERVQTLDELVLIIPRSVFQQFPFDETACSHWHLYGTDYCLTMLTMGKDVYVIPLFVEHKSTGGRMAAGLSKLSFIYSFGLQKEYFSTLGRILNKHRAHFIWVYTTGGYGKWRTSESLFIQRIKYSLIDIARWIGLKVRSF